MLTKVMALELGPHQVPSHFLSFLIQTPSSMQHFHHCEHSHIHLHTQ